jgi:hypothetical protein
LYFGDIYRAKTEMEAEEVAAATAAALAAEFAGSSAGAGGEPWTGRGEEKPTEKVCLMPRFFLIWNKGGEIWRRL